MTHPVEVVVSCCGNGVPIDAELVGIITALWPNGVHTTDCCQDRGDNGTDATIVCPGLDDADRFVGLVRRGYHALHAGNPRYCVQRRFQWWQWWFGGLGRRSPIVAGTTCHRHHPSGRAR
jgi:hypothetical protein